MKQSERHRIEKHVRHRHAAVDANARPTVHRVFDSASTVLAIILAIILDLLVVVLVC